MPLQQVSLLENAAIERDIRLSKKLSYFLRHGAFEAKIVIKPDGYTNVIELLKNHLPGYHLDDIKRVVSNDNKQRFALSDQSGVLEIKANQGHSIKEVNQLELKLVENPNFDIIHGTFLNCWQKIKSKGLSCMKRNHIHFSKGLDCVYCMRQNANLYIYIDFHEATRSNLRFFESENGVILCAGNEQGILEVKYFKKVVTRQGEILYCKS
ncbi:tRNA 2'-phosphotransferase 1 [Venturia canescens]|uniref:tRNA 2'-phosphotransferase 1 n=1 Tax=Venturia canescens TaxID=32260 RepID=UPI001C9BC673|nr:tRNA 2'-phosphotransferase 1 [Venturia canescens]